MNQPFTYTPEQIAVFLQKPLINPQHFLIHQAAPISAFLPNSIAYYRSKRLNPNTITPLHALTNATPEMLIIAESNMPAAIENLPQTFILSDNPRYDFARVLMAFFENQESWKTHSPFQAANSCIHPEAQIEPGCIIGPNCLIGKVKIAANCIIGPYCHIFDNVSIGANTEIHSHCTIGSHGFGFVPNGDTWHRFPHLGGVRIGENVEIFAHTNIDRSSLSDTIIESGVKIDHHCHIGHHSIIRENAIITAQVFVGGDVKIEPGAWIGAHASLFNGITVGRKATVGLGAVVLNDVPENEVVAGNPATTTQNLRERNKLLTQLQQLIELLENQ